LNRAVSEGKGSANLYLKNNKVFILKKEKEKEEEQLRLPGKGFGVFILCEEKGAINFTHAGKKITSALPDPM